MKMRTIKPFALRCLAIVCSVAADNVPSLGAERPTTVCGVLTHLSRYRGKLIAVRGVLMGAYHGQFIQDAYGHEPCEGVRRLGYSWPPALAITQYTTGSDVEDGPAILESNTEEIKAALGEGERQVKGDPSLAIRATFVGELRARKGIQISRTAEGWYQGTGYGQGGQYPALLVLKTVRDVKVVDKDTLGGRSPK